MKRNEFFWRDLGDSALIWGGYALAVVSGLACAGNIVLMVAYGTCSAALQMITFALLTYAFSVSARGLHRHTKYYREERARILGKRGHE